MYTYIYIYIYTYVSTNIYIYIYTYIHIYIYTYIHEYIYGYICPISIALHRFTWYTGTLPLLERPSAICLGFPGASALVIPRTRFAPVKTTNDLGQQGRCWKSWEEWEVCGGLTTNHGGFSPPTIVVSQP